jgi:hypothetical protein
MKFINLIIFLIFLMLLGISSYSQQRRALVYIEGEYYEPNILTSLQNLVDFRESPPIRAFEVVDVNRLILHEGERNTISSLLRSLEAPGRDLPRISDEERAIRDTISDKIRACGVYIHVKVLVLKGSSLVQFQFTITDSLPATGENKQPALITELTRRIGFDIDLNNLDKYEELDRKIQSLFPFSNHPPRIVVEGIANLDILDKGKIVLNPFPQRLATFDTNCHYIFLSNTRNAISLAKSTDSEEDSRNLKYSFKQVNELGGPPLPNCILAFDTTAATISFIGSKGKYYILATVDDGVRSTDTIISLEIADPVQIYAQYPLRILNSGKRFKKIYRFSTERVSMVQRKTWRVGFDTRTDSIGIIVGVNKRPYIISHQTSAPFPLSLIDRARLSFLNPAEFRCSITEPSPYRTNEQRMMCPRFYRMTVQDSFPTKRGYISIAHDVVIKDSLSGIPVSDTVSFETRVGDFGPTALIVGLRSYWYPIDTFNFAPGPSLEAGFGVDLKLLGSLRVGTELYIPLHARATVFAINANIKFSILYLAYCFKLGRGHPDDQYLYRSYSTFNLGLDKVFLHNRFGTRAAVTLNPKFKFKTGAEIGFYVFLH